jgi:GNAT superfamily N-acetyltransferase
LEFPAERPGFLHLLASLYPAISPADLEARFDEVKQRGWCCVGLFDSARRAERLIGMAGYWLATRFCYGRFLYVDHFIVQSEYRGGGVGVKLWEHLEEVARASACRRIVLDTFVMNSVAQRFWMNAGLSIVGFHFGKELGS